MKVILIHNPDAGGEDQPEGDDLMELVRSAGYTCVYTSSKDKGWHEALKGPADILAVAGGDGIVSKVAKKAIGHDCPIAVLPLGTANNIANTLGLTDNSLAQWVTGWPSARRMKFDVGYADGPWGSRHFIEGVGVGLFTEIMSWLDARGNIDLAHANGAIEKISSVQELLSAHIGAYHADWLNVFLDGNDISGEYVLLEAMNIKAIGPNLYLAPDTDPGDGLLDVVCVPEDERDKLSAYLNACLEERSCNLDLTVRRGKHLQIAWHGFNIHIDDEALGANPTLPSRASIDVTVSRASVEFLVPG